MLRNHLLNPPIPYATNSSRRYRLHHSNRLFRFRDWDWLGAQALHEGEHRLFPLGPLPAMVFLAIFMMPFYYGSKARSVPEYLKLRFDEKTRGLNAILFAVMTVFSSGISMHVFALLLGKLLGWDYNVCIA